MSENEQPASAKQQSPDDRRPVAIVVGKAGCGKTSLIRRLSESGNDVLAASAPVYLEERIGVGSVEADLDQLASMLEQHPGRRHLLILVVGAPDRALVSEANLLTMVRAADEDAPVLLVLDKVDMLPPMRSWDPATFDTVSGDPKLVSAHRWRDYVESALRLDSGSVCLACTDPRAPYGIQETSARLAGLIGGTASLDAEAVVARRNSPSAGNGKLDRDEVLREYERLKTDFKKTAPDEFLKGGWFAGIVRMVLETYARTVDADYIRSKYPGAGADNQAQKAVDLAVRHAAIAGGVSGAAASAIELNTPVIGPAVVPALGGVLAGDVAYTTRVQLRAIYDLSVIHRAPLLIQDPEDCTEIFAYALGIKLGESVGDVARVVGPKLVQYNVRRLLRAGLRDFLVNALQKVIGHIAKKLTERAILRLAVPGVSILISSAANGFFTNSLLRKANRAMRRRGATIEPMLRVRQVLPDLDRTDILKILITLMESPNRESGWSEGQMLCLKQLQSALQISDKEGGELDSWFDRRFEDVVSVVPRAHHAGGAALIALLTAAAALDPDLANDPAYERKLAFLAQRTNTVWFPGQVERVRDALR